MSATPVATTATTATTTPSKEETKPASPEAETAAWGDIVDKTPEEKASEKEEAEVIASALASLKIEEKRPVHSEFEIHTPAGAKYARFDTFEDLEKSLKESDSVISEHLFNSIMTVCGYFRPSDIQATSLPMILGKERRNLLAQSQTGTGKSLCMALGMLTSVDPRRKTCQAIYVSPTGPLMHQFFSYITKVASILNKESGSHIDIAYADAEASRDFRRGHRIPQHILIGAPGGTRSYVSKYIDVSAVRCLAFDEADHLLTAFNRDAIAMFDKLRAARQMQILFFSATYSLCPNCNPPCKNCPSHPRGTKSGKEQAMDMLGPNTNIIMLKENVTSNIIQCKKKCRDEEGKFEAVMDTLKKIDNMNSVIMFVNTIDTALKLKAGIEARTKADGVEGVEVGVCYSTRKMDPELQKKTLQAFSDGDITYLISTDVLQRGIDYEDVNVVINFDLPVDYPDKERAHVDNYRHRIGRCGRFGSRGLALNLITDRSIDKSLMNQIEDTLGFDLIEIKEINEIGTILVDAIPEVLKRTQQ